MNRPDSTERTPRNPHEPLATRWLVAAASLVALGSPSCRDWSSFDPRLGSTGTTGGAGGTGAGGTSAGGTTSTGGTGGMTTSMAGAGGTGGNTTTSMAGAGGTGGETTTSMAGAGGTGGGTTTSMAGAGGGGVCTPNVAMPCYDGPAGTEGKGICKGGQAICNPQGTGYGACLSEVLPGVEDCALPGDEDCNGTANDHCAIWSKQFGEDGDQHPESIALDPSGNIVISGFMDGSADFGGGKLVSAGGYDAFVVKLDKTGKHIWSKVLGDPTDQEAVHVATDAQGNVLVTGYFNGSISCGPVVPAVSKGAQDMFVMKFDPAGNCLWQLAFGGTGSEQGLGITADGQGNVFVTGSFDSTTDFGKGALTPVDMLDGVVMKIFPGGTVAWAKKFGAGGDDEGMAVTTTPQGHVLLTGYFGDQIDFGGGAIQNPGGDDVFVTELSGDGGYVFAKGYGGAGTQQPHSIARDGAGNLVVAGDFFNSADFGGGMVMAAGKTDAFVVKLDPSGGHLWTRTFGDPESQNHTMATFDAAADVVFTVSNEGTVDFGGGALKNAGAAGASDIVMVKLAGASGAHVWSREFGDAFDQDARGVVTDPMKNIFVTGEFSGTIDFGSGLLSSVDADDAFVAELPP